MSRGALVNFWDGRKRLKKPTLDSAGQTPETTLCHCGRGGCEASGGRSVFGREVSRPREQKRWLRFPLCLFLLDFILTSVPL